MKTVSQTFGVYTSHTHSMQENRGTLACQFLATSSTYRTDRITRCCSRVFRYGIHSLAGGKYMGMPLLSNSSPASFRYELQCRSTSPYYADGDRNHSGRTSRAPSRETLFADKLMAFEVEIKHGWALGYTIINQWKGSLICMHFRPS